jgi:hypothetical protein
VFFDARAYICVRSERGVKKKFIFFLRSFPERMFREVNGVLSITSTLRGTDKVMSRSSNKEIDLNIRLRPFGKPPNVHYDSLHEIGWLVP